MFCSHCGYSVVPTSAPRSPVEEHNSRVALAMQRSNIKRVAWLFGLLLGGSLILGLVSRTNLSPWPVAITSVVDDAIILIFASTCYREILPLLRIPRFRLQDVTTAAALTVATVATVTLYFMLMTRIDIPFIHYTTHFRQAGWSVASMFVFVAVMPAVFEELAFRGVIQSSLEHVFDGRDAWVIQAALFSVLHLTPVIFPSHFLLGLCLGFLRWRGKSLYPGIVLHGSWNAFILCQELY